MRRHWQNMESNSNTALQRLATQAERNPKNAQKYPNTPQPKCETPSERWRDRGPSAARQGMAEEPASYEILTTATKDRFTGCRNMSSQGVGGSFLRLQSPQISSFLRYHHVSIGIDMARPRNPVTGKDRRTRPTLRNISLLADIACVWWHKRDTSATRCVGDDCSCTRVGCSCTLC